MDMLPFDEKSSAPLSNSMNIFIEDVYNKHRELLTKYETFQSEKIENKEEDPLSVKVESLISSLDEETKILANEKDAMKGTFQKIALQLKNVKWSIMEAERFLQNFEKEEEDKKNGGPAIFEELQNKIERL